MNKYTEQQIRCGYDLVAGGMSYGKASKKSGVSRVTLSLACRGKQWTSLGLNPLPDRSMFHKKTVGEMMKP